MLRLDRTTLVRTLVPMQPCQATLVAGGIRSGFFFATTVPSPNSHAAASPIAAPGSLSQLASTDPTPTISATPPQPSRMAAIRGGVRRSPSIGHARIGAQIGSV